MKSKVSLGSMSPEELDGLIKDAIFARAQMALDYAETRTIIQQVFDSGFNVNGDPIHPKDMGFGITAITGVVKDKGSAGRHTCTLYSIRMTPEDEHEYWTWDEDSPSYLDSDSVKIDGLRRSVSLHSLPDDAIIIQHKMEWNGAGHDRKSVEGFKVKNTYDSDGECIKTEFERVSKSLIRRLPQPPDRDE